MLIIYRAFLTLPSVREFLVESLGDNSLAAVFKNACACNRLACDVSLDMHLSVLLPAPHIGRHLNINCLLEVRIHLLFNGVSLSFLDQTSAKLKAAHVVEVAMGATIAAKDPELLVEDVLAMASLYHSVIHDQLSHHFLGLIASE